MVSSGVYGAGTALTKIYQPAQRSVNRFVALGCLRVITSLIQKARAEWRAPSWRFLDMEDKIKKSTPTRLSSLRINTNNTPRDGRVDALLRKSKKKLSRSYREAIARQKLRDRYLNDLLDDC